MLRRGIEDIYELTPLQQGMLFHALYDPAASMYFEQESYPLHGAIDIPALTRAWQYVARRHPVLRSSFHWEGLAKPVQVVHRDVQLPVDVQDWRDYPPGEQERRLDAYLESDRDRGFDLSTAPLMRVGLIERAPEVTQLTLSFNHMLLDGWSDRLVTDEVWACYEAFCEGKAPRLPKVRPYADYIAWIQRQDLTKAERFWRRELEGFVAPTRFSIDRADRTGAAAAFHVHPGDRSTRLSKQTTAALQRLARENRLTLNTLVQGAWAILASRYSGDTDVVFGVVVSGRPATLSGVETMVGMFLNTLPLRVQVTPEASILPWLAALQTRQTELREYEYSPMVSVQRWSEIPHGAALFDSIVIFENFPVSHSVADQDDDLEEEFRCFQKTNYPLNLMVIPGRRLYLKILYDRDRFDDDLIERMLGHLRTLLEEMADDPHRRLVEVPLLTAAERRRVLVEWNATAAGYAREASLVSLFEAQAGRAAQAPALRGDGAWLSYGELNRRANRLARHLRGLGVGLETRVGVCMQRSVDMVVVLLAILKAGGAYVALDPAYPADRLTYMVADAG